MNRGERIALVGGLAVAGVLALSALAGDQLRARARASVEVGADDARGQPADPDVYDAGHQHLCQPRDMLDRLTGAHPLYRRPVMAGHGRSMLASLGWAWMWDPPSEQG